MILRRLISLFIYILYKLLKCFGVGNLLLVICESKL